MMPLERAVWALVALFLAVGVIGWVAADRAETRPISPLVQKAVELGYFPCEREDSVGPCYWDATVRGNGEGRSFVVTDDNEVFYE